MRKRLRKKQRLGEFRELGFEISASLVRLEDRDLFDGFVDQFIDEAIEGNHLFFGGGGRPDDWSGIAYALTRRGRHTTDQQREAVIQWLGAHPAVGAFQVGGLFDINYEDIASERHPESETG